MDKNPIEVLNELTEDNRNIINDSPTLIERYMDLFLSISIEIKKKYFEKEMYY